MHDGNAAGAQVPEDRPTARHWQQGSPDIGRFDRTPRETRVRKGIVTVAFLCGLLLIPAARVSSPSQAIWLIVGSSLVGLATGNLIVILQCCAPEAEIGLWTGFENFAGNIGGVLAPLLTGLLIQQTGSYFPGFLLAAVVLVAGLLAYWLVVGELHPPGEIHSLER